MSEWIKCSEQMPREGVAVMASGFMFDNSARGRWVEPVFYIEGGFHPVTQNEEGEMAPDFDIDMHMPTHWMPLPTPPTD